MALDSASLRTYSFSVDPTVTDDVTVGYEVGSWWRNDVSLQLFQCLDNTEGAALWRIKPSQMISSFTPTIEFGGASTGIAYNAQQGNIIQIDSAHYISIFIALSSKGTAVGEARVVVLPTANGSGEYAFIFYGHNLSNSVDYTTFGSRISATEDNIRLFEQGDGQPLSALDDTNFVDNSQLFISGFYFT